MASQEASTLRGSWYQSDEDLSRFKFGSMVNLEAGSRSHDCRRGERTCWMH